MRNEFKLDSSIKEKSTLYNLMGDEKVGSMKSSFNLVRDILVKGSEDEKSISLSIHDPHSTKRFPSITVTSPGDSWSGSNTLGGGETSQTALKDGGIVPTYQLRFDSQINIIITSQNQLDTEYLYRVMRNGLAGMLSVVALSGIGNPKVSGRKMSKTQGKSLSHSHYIRGQ